LLILKKVDANLVLFNITLHDAGGPNNDTNTSAKNAQSSAIDRGKKLFDLDVYFDGVLAGCWVSIGLFNLNDWVIVCHFAPGYSADECSLCGGW
jgi:hypothetical protein